MTSLTIRKLDERLERRPRVRAASLGRSMEEEVHHILRAALEDSRHPMIDLVEFDQTETSSMSTLLDSNVLSEFLRASPDAAVVARVAAQALE